MSLHIIGRRAAAQSLDTIGLCRAFSTTLPIRAVPPRRQTATDNLTSSIQKDMQRSTSRDPVLMDKVNQWSKMGPSKALAETREMGEERQRAAGMERLQGRVWRDGDVYAPHDLSPVEMRKWRTKKPPTADVFDVLNINPLDEWKNPELLMDFMTTAGRIKHRRETGLRPVNQRKLAKAVRRAIGMGFHPSVHAHPELLRRKRSSHHFD